MEPLPSRVEMPVGRARVILAAACFAGLVVYSYVTGHDFITRWLYSAFYLLVAAGFLRGVILPPGLLLHSLGFEVRGAFDTKRYAWANVSEFKTMPPLVHSWIEFRDKTQSDLAAAEFIPLGILSRPVEEVCALLNAFRQRALQSGV